MTSEQQKELVWQKAEKNMAHRERGRLIRLKRITFRGLPNVLVNVDGSWKFPSLKAAQG